MINRTHLADFHRIHYKDILYLLTMINRTHWADIHRIHYKDMKTEKNEVMVSGIIPRNYKYNDKGMDVDKFLISFCLTCKFYFIDNSNINKETHLNMSGLHLNAKGQYALGTNLLNSIKL